jgi:uncharacterized Zn finger protein
MTTATKRRENVREKGARLLVSGRLRVTSVVDGEIRAECRGDSGEVYTLGRVDEVWRCSCPARTACSHLHALWAVTAVDR